MADKTIGQLTDLSPAQPGDLLEVERPGEEESSQSGYVDAGDFVMRQGAEPQVLSGFYPYDFHDYGALSNDDIEIDPRYHFGVIERDNTSNEIMAPATPPDHHIAIRILIVGTSSTGSPSLTGWDNTDQGDDLPGEDEMAWLRIDLSPEAMTAVVEAINY